MKENGTKTDTDPRYTCGKCFKPLRIVHKSNGGYFLPCECEDQETTTTNEVPRG